MLLFGIINYKFFITRDDAGITVISRVHLFDLNTIEALVFCSSGEINFGWNNITEISF